MLIFAMEGVGSAALAPMDWLVIGLYFALLAGSGAFFAWRARVRAMRSANEYFTGGHAMPVWAVAISILATAQSAATFTGVPELAYTGNLGYLSTNIGGLIAAVILAVYFIPAFYKQNVTTPYQLLEKRFGPGAKLAASWSYMIGRVFASGARVYIGAIPVSIALWGDDKPGHMAIAIAGFMAFGTVYTLAGGIASVIWTDVIQVCVYLGAAVLVIGMLAAKVTAPWPEVYQALSTGGPGGASKLTLFPTGFTSQGFDWGQFINIFTIPTRFVLITLASHGADQDLVQRMLSCKSAAKGSWSVISGLLVGTPAVAIFLALGLLLWVYYQRPELMGGVAKAHAEMAPGEGRDVVLRFIMNELAATGTGAAGLMVAGVMAAGPAGINSGLNSMASTFVTDVYRPRVQGRSEAHYVRVSRLAIVVWGVVLGGFALLCIPWFAGSGQTIIDFVLSVMNFAYAGLLGVFFTALFTKRGNVASVTASLIIGAFTVLMLRPDVWRAMGWSTPAEGVKAFSLAWPWQLVIASAVATMVCVAGRPKAMPSSIPE